MPSQPLPVNETTYRGNARVAPTAYFTASAWARAGFPQSQLFDTWLGRALYTPVDRLSTPIRRLTPSFGYFIEFLWLRHQWLESRIRQLQPGLVIEIGAGLSSRGLALSESGVCEHYLELDLPNMVAAKKRLLGSVELPPNYRLDSVDLLAHDFAQRLDVQTPDSGPVVVVTEGVCDYLSFDQKRRAWSNIAGLLEQLGGGHYLLEIHSLEHIARYGPAAHALTTLLGWLTGDDFQQRLFHSPDQALDSLGACGFKQAALLDPDTLDKGELNRPSAACFFDLAEAVIE